MKIKELLLQATEQLSVQSQTPKLDAELLLAAVLEFSQAQLMTYPEQKVGQAQITTFKQKVAQRAQGQPVAYILGYKDFWQDRFMVTPEVLIPRPETECLVEACLQSLNNKNAAHIADLGTGSGAIALSVARECPLWHVHATDISESALRVANQNKLNLELENVEFFSGSWCAALPHQNYDAIISNPPYIDKTSPALSSDGVGYEPLSALVAEDKGFADFVLIIKQAKQYLKPNGLLLLEHGADQQIELMQMLTEAGFDSVTGERDLADLPRFVCGYHN